MIGTEIIERADYICFTGSTATGKHIAKQCAERLIGCSLELGGKNPILVLRDADLDKAAEGAVRASFSNAGQLCVSMERMFVADQVYDRFLARFVERTKAMNLKAGPGVGQRHGLADLPGPARHRHRARRRRARPRAPACSPAAGPGPTSGPTTTSRRSSRASRPAMTCFGDETFGPVISVYRFSDEADAVARANEGEYGLNASIYTRDVKRGRASGRGRSSAARSTSTRRSARRSPASTRRWAACASPGWAAARAPRASTATPSRSRSATQRAVRFAPMFGMSDETYAKLMTANLRLMKKLGGSEHDAA